MMKRDGNEAEYTKQIINQFKHGADAIAHATKRVITEKMAEDPAFYGKFSRLINDIDPKAFVVSF